MYYVHRQTRSHTAAAIKISEIFFQMIFRPLGPRVGAHSRVPPHSLSTHAFVLFTKSAFGPSRISPSTTRYHTGIVYVIELASNACTEMSPMVSATCLALLAAPGFAFVQTPFLAARVSQAPAAAFRSTSGPRTSTTRMAADEPSTGVKRNEHFAKLKVCSRSVTGLLCLLWWYQSTQYLRVSTRDGCGVVCRNFVHEQRE